MNKVDNPREALIQSFKIPTQYKNYILFEGRVIIRFTDQSNFYYLVCLIIKSNQMINPNEDKRPEKMRLIGAAMIFLSWPILYGEINPTLAAVLFFGGLGLTILSIFL